MEFNSKCSFTPPTILWGFSFALGHGVSPQSRSSAPEPCSHCSSTYCLAGASLPSDVGYLLTVTSALCRITLLAPTSNAEETEVKWFYEDLQRPSRTNTQKMSFSLECKSRKSRNTQSNRQICPWITEWSRAKANRLLPRECTGDSKHPLPTTQEKTLHMDITRWSIQESDWLYSLQSKMEKLYRISKKQDQELAQIMNSLLPNSELNWRK